MGNGAGRKIFESRNGGAAHCSISAERRSSAGYETAAKARQCSYYGLRGVFQRHLCGADGQRILTKTILLTSGNLIVDYKAVPAEKSSTEVQICGTNGGARF